MTLYLILHALEWLLLIVLGVAVYLLYWYHGRMLLNTIEARLTQGPDLSSILPSALLEQALGLPSNESLPALIFCASTKCAPCLLIRETLASVAERYKSRVRFVVVCKGDLAAVLDFARPLSPLVSTVADVNGSIQKRLGITSTPFAFVVDARGGVVRKTSPANSPEAFDRLLSAVTSTGVPAALVLTH